MTTLGTLGYGRFGLALGLVLILIGLLAWLGRRAQPWLQNAAGVAGGRLALVERLPLDAAQKLLLVRCDDQEHLLLLAADRIQVIASQPARPATSTPTPASGGAP